MYHLYCSLHVAVCSFNKLMQPNQTNGRRWNMYFTCSFSRSARSPNVMTGCGLSRESCTKQQCSHSRSGPPRYQPTSAVTYRHVTVRGTFDRLAPPCCHDLPLGLTSPRGFRHLAPAVWNSLPRTVLDSRSLTVFKSRLKTHLFHLANTD